MWHSLSTKEVESKLQTDLQQGLSDDEITVRLKKYGENKLQEPKKESVFVKFLKQFNDFMIIILIIAAIISAVVAKMQGTGEYIDSIIIITIVVLNAIMGVVQEAKAEKSLEALKKMSAPVAKVKRNGKIITVASTNIVPGDILILEAGNYIPADCRLISSYNLKVEESSLTGEIVPILKDANIILKDNISLGDTINMGFATTIVVNGHAEAIATDTGMNTKVGKIAKMIITDEAPETPIQKKLGEVGKSLGIGCLIICLLIFVIGLLKKIEPVEMFMTSVGLAVAAIPEGLPAIVTIMLSIGVTKMAKKNTIIRKLPAVETLGSSSVICSDKTGTLTQNKMQVVDIQDVNGNNSNKSFTLELGCMCTDSQIVTKDGREEAEGEATENAIVNAGLKIGKNKENLYRMMQRVNEIPFDSERKMMTTIHKIGSKYRIITKGAPDVLIKRCSKYYEEGIQKTITSKQLNGIDENNNKMANNALRVLAIAYKDVDRLPNKIDSENIEKELTFVGLIGMIDPPREGVKEAVATCRKAGIKTVMITGDHITTAKAIAREIGILRPNDLAITGSELDSINQKTLEKDIMKYSVFARVSPEHKVRIVKAFRSTGAVVAMTGDGVNDAPALKRADIGVGMGIAGTDVTKNVADMVLSDDNFATIVSAVKEGRRIYNNIKKAIQFLLSSNISEIISIFVATIMGFRIFSPIHILWINLVTDTFPALCLGMESEEHDLMKQRPRLANESLFTGGLSFNIAYQGILISLITLASYFLGVVAEIGKLQIVNSVYGTSMAFLTMSMAETFHSFNVRSLENSLLKMKKHNVYLIASMIFSTLLINVAIYVKPLAKFFEVVQIRPIGYFQCMALAFSIIPVVEIVKFFQRKKK